MIEVSFGFLVGLSMVDLMIGTWLGIIIGIKMHNKECRQGKQGEQDETL